MQHVVRVALSRVRHVQVWHARLLGETLFVFAVTVADFFLAICARETCAYIFVHAQGGEVGDA